MKYLFKTLLSYTDVEYHKSILEYIMENKETYAESTGTLL